MAGPENALLPREPAPGSPVFAESWQAEVLAIADGLVAAGLFSASDWAETLGAARERDRTLGRTDSEETYYLAVLASLETLVRRHAPDVGASLEPRVAAWRRAYLATPHGQPVTLDAADREPVEHGHGDGHDHDHDHGHSHHR